MAFVKEQSLVVNYSTGQKFGRQLSGANYLSGAFTRKTIWGGGNYPGVGIILAKQLSGERIVRGPIMLDNPL